MKSQTIERDNGTLHIKTNGIPRDIISGYELSESERKDYDYMTPDELDPASFFRYKGNVYSMGDFMSGSESWGYDATMSDSFFSGIAIKLVDDNERVIVARYWA